MGLYNFRGNFISEDAVAQTVMQSGLCPVNSTQTINSSGQVTGATYTYADGSSITAAFTYADTSAKDYSSASYSLNAVGGGGSTPTATGYTLTAPAGDLTLNTAVTFTVTATGGAFASGTTITPSVTGVTGTFSPTSLSGAGSFTFTPTTAGTAVVSTTNNQSLPNPSSVSMVVTATVSANRLNYASLTANVTVDTNNVVSLPSINSEMAVSSAIPLAQFSSVKFIAADPIRQRGVSVGVYEDATLSKTFATYAGLKAIVSSGSLSVRAINDGSTNYTGVVSPFQPLAPNTIVKISKAPNGVDAIVSISTDDATYTEVLTRPNAFAGLTNVFIKVIKEGNGDGQGNALAPEITSTIEAILE